MKVSIHQINTIVGDFSGNIEKIVAAGKESARMGASLAIFPELSVTGYPPLDLLENSNFLLQASGALDTLADKTRDLGVSLIVGTILPSENPAEGKPLSNTAVLLERGSIKAIHRKVLLPTYDVFDENRYFEPGGGLTTVQASGSDFALSTCEDVWNDKTFWTTRQYHYDPVEDHLAATPMPLINIAASPFSQGKGSLRVQMLANIAKRFGYPVIYVNQVGGNDSLVFDGRSLVMDPEGKIVHLADGFAEDTLLVDLEDLPAPLTGLPEMDGDESIYQALVTGLRDYTAKCGFPSTVLGLSGGIDSSVTAALCVHSQR